MIWLTVYGKSVYTTNLYSCVCLIVFEMWIICADVYTSFSVPSQIDLLLISLFLNNLSEVAKRLVGNDKAQQKEVPAK